MDWGGTIYARNAVLSVGDPEDARVGPRRGKNWLHYRLTGPNRGDAGRCSEVCSAQQRPVSDLKAGSLDE